MAGGAELHLGLEIVARVRRHDNDVETNPSADNHQKQTGAHGFLLLPCLLPCQVDPSIQRKGSGGNPGYPASRQNRREMRRLGLYRSLSRVTMQHRQLFTKSIVKSQCVEPQTKQR